MKLIIYSILFVAISKSAVSQSRDIEELKKLNEAWITSYPKKDTTTIGKILAPDFSLVNPFGNKFTRNDILGSAIKNEGGLISANVETVEVRLVGNVGLVNAVARFVNVDQGKEVTSRTNYLDVYEKRNGRWVAVAAHVTLLK